jgi:GNAT superfamily N-acetyltransferase
VRRLACEPAAHSPAGPGNELLRGDRYVIWIGLNRFFTHVQAVHFRPAETDAYVAEVRARLAALGLDHAFWWLSSSFTPPGVSERLAQLGLLPADRPPIEPESTAMVLVEPPAPGPPDVEVRQVETYEELLASLDIMRAALDIPDERYSSMVANAPEMWANRDSPGARSFFLAFVDGRPVARAIAAFAPAGGLLYGAATLPETRGRGAYRALVRARWDEAVRRGTPALAVQAGEMSRPILERLGFRAAGQIDVLVDEGPW